MHNSYANSQDIDIRQVFSEIWQAKFKIILLALIAGALTGLILSLLKPQYTAMAKLLIVKDEAGFTRPTFQNASVPKEVLDKAAITSQVQVLLSNDLAVEVAKQLNLSSHKEFQTPNSSGLKQVLVGAGLSTGFSKVRQEEFIRLAFNKKRKVYQIGDSRVIAIEFTSSDPDLAPKAANLLAEKYLLWQKKAQLEQTIGATSWLKEQIDSLRIKVANAEAQVARYQSANGLLSGSNNVRLDKQQLSELNSQLILAATKHSETEARSKLIRSMMQRTGDIKEFSDVLQSGLIQRLLEQRVQIQRRLSELSPTYMSSHPTIERLRSELAGLQSQIKRETEKIVISIENEAKIAKTRENSLRQNLSQLTASAGDLGQKKARLQELEREAETSRTILEAYLARYNEAAKRDDRAMPTLATVISHAYKSSVPSFPKTKSFIMLAMFGAFVLGLLIWGTIAILRHKPSEHAMALNPSEKVTGYSSAATHMANSSVHEPQPEVRTERDWTEPVRTEHAQAVETPAAFVQPSEPVPSSFVMERPSSSHGEKVQDYNNLQQAYAEAEMQHLPSNT